MSTETKNKIVTIEARDLKIHPYAQRRLNHAKLRALRERFDLDAIGVLHAVQYVIDGEFGTWTVDGQHRQKLLMLLGLGEWPVHVMIHSDVTTDARAAQLFLELNDRANVSCFSKFKNEVTAGLSPAVEITEIVEARGLKTSTHPGDGLVRCVNALKAAYAHNNGLSLVEALDTILAAWGDGAAGLDGHVIQGIAQVYATFTGKVDKAVLTRKLAQFPGGACGLLGAARGLKAFRNRLSVAACLAELVVDAYNVKRTTRRLERPDNQSAAQGGTRGRS